MIPPEITRDLQNGMGLEECLIKHNTNLKTLMTNPYTFTKELNDETKYIEKSGRKWYVKRRVNGKTKYYGYYRCLEDAQRVRDRIIELDWKQSKVDSVCKELGIERIPSKNEGRYYES